MGDSTSIATIGFIASAGLTVSLFVAGEAFEQDPKLAAQAKMGALLSVIVALIAIIGGKGHQLVTSRVAKNDSSDKFSIGPRGESNYTIADDEALEEVVVENTVNN